MSTKLFILIALAIFKGINGLTIGTQSKNDLPPLQTKVNGVVENNFISLDANWHWVHSKSNPNQNCFPGGWDSTLCSNPDKCWQQCAIEGIPKSQWAIPYGTSVDGNKLRLNYVTNGPYGTNVGSRWYLVNSSKKRYRSFNLLNRRFSFTVDVSNIPCGVNGAVYFVEMPMNGGPNLESGDPAAYGLGYCDAQCTNIKFINGFANTNNSGSCCAEMDIWEANSYATQFTPHTAKRSRLRVCRTPKECGWSDRYGGITDMDGGDYNNQRLDKSSKLYGRGPDYTINTLLPLTVHTDFITNNGTDSGNLIEIRRFYEQNGKIVFGGALTDEFIADKKKKFGEVNQWAKFGGMKSMGDSLRRGHVLVLSLWDDSAANMMWLDSVYPVGSKAPGAYRGPCPAGSGIPDQTRAKYPNSYVIYSDIQLNTLGAPQPSVNYICQQCVQKTNWTCQTCKLQ
jgi:cellulose 1,4-beta-cellobiosidase